MANNQEPNESEIQEPRPYRMQRRSYYSEVITDVEHEPEKYFLGATKRTMFTWKVRTEKFAPVIHWLIPPVRPIFLAPAERWMCAPEEKAISFPVETLKPKVQMQYVVRPKALPRKVEVERRRRAFAAKHIKKELDDLNVKPQSILPVNVVEKLTGGEKGNLYSKYNFLPLDLFDNIDYDERTPEDWLGMGYLEGVRHPIPAEAFLPIPFEKLRFDEKQKLDIIFDWTPVAVTHYNSHSSLFHVLTLDGYQNIFRVPRIYLMFKAEDPTRFAKRVAFAVALRNEVENLIRYEFYLDCMVLTGAHDIEEPTLERVFQTATRNKFIKIVHPEFAEKLEHEIRLNHKRAFCEMEFRRCVTMHPNIYSFLTLPQRPPERVPEKACVETGMQNFYEIRDYIRWYIIYVIPEPYMAIAYVVQECQKVATMSTFTLSYGKFVPLDEFQSLQTHTTNNCIKYLKFQWVDTVTHNITMALRDVGKGWFELNTRHWDFFAVSKIRRLLELTKFHMQYALRCLVSNSVHMFVNLLETPCQCCLNVEDEFVWGKDIYNTQFKPSAQAVFGVLIRLSDHGPYYTTNPDDFPKILLHLYVTAVTQTHFVKQVQPFLLRHLQFADDLLLSSVGLLDPLVSTLQARLERGFTKAIIPLKAYAKEYARFTDLFELVVPDFIQEFKNEEHSAAEVKEEVSKHLREKNYIYITVPENIIIGPFYINVAPLKTFLMDKRQEIATKLLDMFAARMREIFEATSDEYKLIYLKLLHKPESIEQIYEMKEFMETIPMSVKNIEDNVKRLVMEYDILNDFCYSISNEDFDMKWEVIAWPFKISNQIETTIEFLIEETDKYFKIHLEDESVLQDKIDYYTVQVTNLSKISDINRVEQTAIEVRRLWKQMNESKDQGILLNQRQKLFLQPVVQFDSLNKLIKEFEPFKTLWLTAGDWFKYFAIWMHNPLINVDGESIDRICTDIYKTMVKMVKTFADFPFIQSIAVEVRDQCDKFKPFIPLIQALRNPGLKDRHYENISNETGVKLDWSGSLSFGECLDKGLFAFSENVTKIAEAAGKEYAIEQALDKMSNDWERIFLDLVPYKETGTCILKIPDEIMQMLDDHVVATQQISFSPFKASFAERIEEWEQTLRITIDVLEMWAEVQKNWMYLEPIFTSDDISKQLPTESKKYNAMERTWRRIIKNALERNKLILFCPDPKLLDSLKECFGLLEIVQKGLCDYLETKRSNFPRFYFLSDDELLEILSQAKNPLAVQPHLKKCFESISTLTFEPNLEMTYMNSGDGESVKLNPSLFPVGGVENWMLVVESSMQNTIRTVLKSSLVDMMTKPRQEWVLSWPGQVVIAGCQTAWTAGVEEAIRNEALPNFYDYMLKYLDSLRDLVKGSLSWLQREIISALIVIEVHARDVTENLVEQNVKSVNDFDWISQLRYYWVNNEHLKVRAVNAEFQYGYEYLGNTGRLVITPLTDRCYLTLTGALHLKMGGAPAGPAGTGKTETTKDLGKAMAIQCVVFNCSDQLDYRAMGKFFKGLASSGAWACFDEFNRIDIEVLSVIAQQVTTIQKAQVAKMERFMFEGVEIALKLSCAVFITMNPGYAGRSELPDNLKALFRPVAMMVPNYTLIAEISLFSFGFGDARALAGKITTTFKLSSEQLSSQDHYDFGMRAVKTVIAVAGNLKREKPLMDERQIVLRALRDVNVPKFLRDDLKLFNGVVSDLFPRMVEEAIDYGILEASIRNIILKKQLEDVNEYVMKVIQLFETTVVRHGLMLVGPTGSGKTQCYEVLQGALTALRGQPSPSGLPFTPVHTFVLNPKSITMGQLYGEFDPNTHEWTDGILPSLVRVGASAEDRDKRWYVLDGPVDAVWIENMNTVLDDNKKLCLTSGEIIKLKDTQRMVFEVADLAVASPATVSRCGMVFLEPSVLGLQPFLNCWFHHVPNRFKEYKPQMLKLFSIYLLPAVEFLRSHMRELVTSVDSAIVISCLNLLNYRLRPLLGKDGKPPPAPNFQNLMDVLLVPWLVWSIIWSIGATCDNQSRELFSEWMRNKMKEHLKDTDISHLPPFPAAGLVYDYRLIDGGFTDPTDDGEPQNPSWRSWLIGVDPISITPETKYSDIEVPTMDNIRSAELIGILLLNENNVLCVGPTGTGKTQTIMSKLSKNMHKKFICDFIMFSARTSANQTQDLLDSKLDKRRKGIYGPPLLRREVFFIDDFNMPGLEVYGAQPPIELIRQWMDFSGWYDRKEVGVFKTIVDVNFIVGMGPPGGGRNPITARLMRHFHYIGFIEMEDTSKAIIFGTIVKSWLSRTREFEKYSMPLVEATLSIYSTVLKELLPTPAKTHYTFNLRDLSKVFQGMLMKEPESMSEMTEFLRLWYHENCRVFQDRMVNDYDRKWFDQLMRSKIKSTFNVDPEETLDPGELGVIIFGDFIDPTADTKSYVEITDWEHISRSLDEYLTEYNNQTTKPMKLVMFIDAICHVARIARIIRQPLGNCLLLGMGGSGRQSLTRLAAHMAEYNCFQIELSKSYSSTDWRDDIKKCMLKAGLMNILTVFLFSDTQIKSESFLEDLNNILNSGDVPNIYQFDELDKIYNGMKGPCQDMGMIATKTNLFSCYQKFVRSNLHVCITMSPIGEIFRARLRQFPALVNCCTIDWFSAWPDSALQSVAMQFLNDIEDLDVTDEILQGIVVTCQYMHQSVVEASDRYLAELMRHNYVTPTSYLELLQAYTILMGKKKGELRKGVFRLKTGLDKLVSTGEEVKALQVQLAIMKPALEKAAKEAEIMIAQIAEDTKVAEATKADVEGEEKVANAIAAESQAIAEDAQRDLDEALPALQAAEDSLKALNKNDVTEVKAMKRPPLGVLLVIETICILNDIKPLKVAGEKPGTKVNDYWPPGQGMLADPGAFLTALMNFDKARLTQEKINQLKPYINNPNFHPAQIIKVSKACTSLCMWTHAMFKYYHVDLGVAPKKAALAQAKADLAVVEGNLKLTKAKMQMIMDGLDELNRKLQEKISFKEEQEAMAQLCMDRMGRAVRLVGGLADEKVRWLSTIDSLEVGIYNVTGDILLSSGAVAYLTPFTDEYRRALLTSWNECIQNSNVPHSPGATPVSILGDAVQIRLWQLDGLPRDSLSTENAVLVKHSRRWPLFIDPQGQANKWIRNMGKLQGISVVKLSDKDLMRSMESGIRFGKPVLIENVGEELDPALDPILQRQLFRQGGQWVIKLGDVVVPYSDDFQLYITTKLANPHYTPEVSIKVLIVNFTLVPSGLQDQLLALVVAQERPDLEEARSLLVTSSAQMKHELKEIEDRILQKLSLSEGSPVDDIDLIVTLEASKVKSEDIKAKVAAAEITQVDIDTTRALYIPVANRGQLLFFCVADLSTVDPMYQYSLEWFTTIFVNSMSNTEPADDIEERIEIINNYFTFSLYSNVCRSLFERNKLHFAFLLCIRIQMDQHLIDHEEWHYFLAGGSPEEERPNPAPEWLDSRAWTEVLAMDKLPAFKQFVASFSSHLDFFRKMFDSTAPHRMTYPSPFDESLSDFQKMCVLKCIRPGNVTNAMQDYLHKFMGARFIEPQTSDLTAMYSDAGPTIPLIFVLSAGTDPASDLYKFADKMKMSKRMLSTSLGQGQGPIAEKLLRDSAENGGWLFLQNCHLAPSWMPRLEYLIENLGNDGNVHKDLRIWLTSTPSPSFPVAILQNGSKMTVEPPRGIKANMLKAYLSPVAEYYDFFHSSNEKLHTFKFMLFSLCLFHGVCLERRKFGPLGFNIAYEFTDGDLRICISQLHMFLLEYTEIPFKVLTYTAGHINYGGRVTDDWDRRCLLNILGDYYRIEVVNEEHTFDARNEYHQIDPTTDLAGYVEYVKTLPINDNPDLFGLHPNADISCARALTYLCLSTLLALQPRTVSGASQSAEELTSNIANSILDQMPDPLDSDLVTQKYPVMYEESLNTVLGQEVIRFNRLIKIILQSLKDLLKALKGLVVMSEQLEALSNSLFSNQVPKMWAGKAYPSLKPLGAWVLDLKQRIAFLMDWIDNGIPLDFWISGFFFPQAFLTGTLQNFARKYILSIDSISYSFKVLKARPTKSVGDGCCIYGLFLEGGRWNAAKQVVDESRPKELYTELPCLWLVPEQFHKVSETGIYICPVYKTLVRAGTLSTTGHSTNYVLAIEIPSDRPQQHWVKRGCALFCALDF